MFKCVQGADTALLWAAINAVAAKAPLPSSIWPWQLVVDGKVVADGISDGVDGTVKTAMSVECVVDKLFYRTHVPPPDGSQEYMVREATEDGMWGRGLKDHTEQMMKQAMSAK